MGTKEQKYVEFRNASLLAALRSSMFMPGERYIIAPPHNQSDVIHEFCRKYGYTVTYRRGNGEVVCLPSEEAIRLEEVNDHLGKAITELCRLADSNDCITPDQQEWHDQIEGVRNAICVHLGI